jgi:hypothetical protein
MPITEDPDSDDEIEGGKFRVRASLTWLQRVVCRVTGQPTPGSPEGDDTMLLTVCRILMQTRDPDLAANELLELLSYEAFDDVCFHSRFCAQPCAQITPRWACLNLSRYLLQYADPLPGHPGQSCRHTFHVSCKLW